MSGRDLPMMPWFPKDFYTATAHWANAERAAYRTLLDYQWMLGELPPDHDQLARLVGVSRDEFEVVWPVISRKFVNTETGLVNNRLESHRIEALRLKESRAQGARSATAQRLAQRTPSEQPADAQRTPSERPLHASISSPSPSPSVIPKRGEEDQLTLIPPAAKPRPSKKAPQDFTVTSEMREWASREAKDVPIDRATAKFMDHTFASAKTDWLSTWRNWMREEQDRITRGRGRRPEDEPRGAIQPLKL